MKKIIVSFLLLIISSFLVNAGTINVPDDYSTIQAGLNAADSSDTVLVQPGTYYENIFWPDKNGIKLKSAGDSSNTIIDVSGNGSVIHMSPSSANIDSTTLIKGFTLQNGGNINYGGGIFINNSSPKLILLYVKNNNADEKGGGIYCKNSSPVITEVTISGNLASSNGGGIYCYINSSPTITDVTISDNSANYGGGIYCGQSSLSTITDVTISDNSASQGGGIYCGQYSLPTITDVTISDNSASDGGGGFYCFETHPTLTDVTISNNSADDGRGGGIYCYNSDLTLADLTISQNSSSSGGGIYCRSSSLIITEVTISCNSADNGGGIYCTSSVPNLSKITFFDNYSLKGDGIYIESRNSIIDYCNFANQNYSIFNKDNSVIIEATNNWFGSSSGPYHPIQNPSGIGDSVNAFVNVTPWLTEPDTDAPPIPVQNLHISSIGNDFIELSWDPSPLGDLSGYKICYKTDTTEFFYTDTIDVGNVTSYSLAGLSAGSTYYIAAICYDTDGNESWYSSEVFASVPVVGLQSNGKNVPSEYSLSQNYPNPFNPTTTISYQLPKSSFVKLIIYDISGRLIDKLVNEKKNAGYYSVEWNAENVSSGIYFYRIDIGEFGSVKKCLFIK